MEMISLHSSGLDIKGEFLGLVTSKGKSYVTTKAPPLKQFCAFYVSENNAIECGIAFFKKKKDIEFKIQL